MKDDNIMIAHRKKVEEAQQSIDRIKEKVAHHEWRSCYHLAPPAQWMNDPNGFCFYQGEYHLFYQHHPFSPEWGPMYWGHYKSKDLAFWESLPIALAPSEDYDIDGCFSGSAIEKDGKLYLMYTGNVWTGSDREENLKQVQALAVSKDGVHFEKLEINPVIAKAPDGDIHPYHFRDPKVWKHQDQYYTVLGSKTKTNKGQALLYRSSNLMEWEYVNIMARSEGNLGYMWECPDFFHIDDQEVLVISPQGMKSEGIYYHNLHQSGYVFGQLNYDTGEMNHGSFQLLDYGFDFYAPQTMIDDKGRRILIAWMDMWESEMPTQEFGWAGSMTLPRVLQVKNNQLISMPVPELEMLRENEVSYSNIPIHGERSLDQIAGDCIELNLTIDVQQTSTCGLKVRVNQETNEETVLTYHKNEGLFLLDRSRSGKGAGGIRKTDVVLKNNELQLRIFIDKSSIEIFINGGERVMTSRIYPSPDATGVFFFADGPTEVLMINKWDLRRSIEL